MELMIKQLVILVDIGYLREKKIIHTFQKW